MAKKNVKTKNNAFGTPPKKAAKKSKPEPVTYTKKYDAFPEFAECIINIPGYIGNMLSVYDFQDRGNIRPVELQLAAMELIAENIPDIDATTNEQRNQFWSFNMSLDRCSIKTGNFIALSWQIEKKYNSKESKYDILSVTATFTSYNTDKTKNEIKYLEGRDWESI